MARYCGNCGTEVDETAVFCPTCGQPIDQAAETEIPAAPAWPDPPQEAGPVAVERPAPVEPAAAGEAVAEPPRVADATRVEVAPPPMRSVPPTAPAEHEPPRSPAVNVPLTLPVTMSGWLIGGGALVAALGTVIALFSGTINPFDLLLLLLLLGIAVTVFFSASVPDIPHLRLATLAVVLVVFGIGLDRIGFGFAGIGELLLFLGAAAAAIGAILLELGRDQPLGGPRA